MFIYTLPFLSALLLFLASPSVGISAFSWVSLVPFFLFLEKTTVKKAFFFGWGAGVLYFIAMLYWVTISMETYGGLTPALSISALVLLSIYMATYQGLFAYIIARTLKTNPIFPIWSVAFSWVALDYIRGFLFTGLPWMDIGYFHYLSPIRQLADLGGHHGLTFLIVLVNGVLCRFIQNRSLRLSLKQTSLAIACIALACIYPTLRLSHINTLIKQAPVVQTGVIQGNIDQAEKWKPDNKLKSVNTYIRLTHEILDTENPPELILWPETALPFYPTFDPVFYHVQAETVLKENAHFELLCGAPHIIPKDKSYDLYNAALLLRPDKSTSYYYKQHLVPFGEYIPLRGILPLPHAIVESIGDFSQGTEPRLLQAKQAQIGALICIEAIYPDLARQQVQDGATLLANITNDAWFGRSSAPTQHLAMTLFRAIENRRSLARSANTGISALISPTGAILESSALFSEAALVQPLPLLSEQTFFTRVGYLFPQLCLVLAIISFIRTRRSKAIDDQSGC